MQLPTLSILFFFFNDTATTEIYTLSLHDALPISCAESSAAKIESQNRNANSVQGFRRLVDHFVVHRTAKKRMRMADNRGERRLRGGGGGPEDRFRAIGGNLQKEHEGFVCAGD